MEQRGPLIIGNWKMNGSQTANAQFLSALKEGVQHIGGPVGCSIALCAPFPYLNQLQSSLKTSSIAWGAQDVSGYVGGAYTGEVSAAMLNDFSCSYALVGHSERRQYHAESDATVVEKVLRLLEVGIVPVVCVGETLQERNDGLTEFVAGRQLNSVLSVLDAATASKLVIAYEPVWAIGTGVTATPDMAQQVHAFLRNQLALKEAALASKIPILYGGSMKPDNAPDLLQMPDIDGGLIGGASLKAAEFLSIIDAAKKPVK